MYPTFILIIIFVGACAALAAWYYNRAFQSVRYEYLGSPRSGMSGHADDTYVSLVRPLRQRRRIATWVATVAFCVAAAIVGLNNA